jgi:hypothetical protein
MKALFEFIRVDLGHCAIFYAVTLKLNNPNDSSSYIACFANSLVEPFFPNFKMTFLLFSWGSFHQTTRHITPHIVIVSKENVGEYKVQT